MLKERRYYGLFIFTTSQGEMYINIYPVVAQHSTTNIMTATKSRNPHISQKHKKSEREEEE